MYGGNNWGASQSYRNQSPQKGPPEPWQRGQPPRTGSSPNFPRPVPASGSDAAQLRNQFNSRFDEPFYNQESQPYYSHQPRQSQQTFNHGFERPNLPRPMPAFGSTFPQFRNQSKYNSDWNSTGSQQERNRVEVDNSLTIRFEEPETKPFNNQESQPSTSIRKYPNYKGPQISEPKDNYTFKEPDQNPNFDDTKIHLDWYNSDLNMDLDCTDYCSVRAMSSQGFGYMWSGIRATYGVTKGKVCYEVQITSNQPTDHLGNEETHPHVIRVGWSLDSSSLQLGTENFSYGFGGTGKASTSNKFFNYGRPFGLGDVIGCYLDLTSTPMTIAYTLNGNFLGVAFRISRSELKGQALFPHVMTKNQDFLVNFGQLPNSLAPLNTEFTIIGHLDVVQDGLVRATKGPETKADCEVLQMVGLPGAGKTYWANQLCQTRPEKRYNILGTNNLIDKMKVMGLTRNRNYAGRWDALITKCTECFNVLLRRALQRKRNYILDQTNVYPTARMRKMRDFLGYTIKTVIVVPDQETYLRRCKMRAEEEGKEVPADALLTMKANFVLPELSENYGEVFYVALGPEAAAEQINAYNQEAWNAGCKTTDAVKKIKRSFGRKRRQLNDFRPNGKMWPTIKAEGPSTSNVKTEEMNNFPSTSSVKTEEMNDFPSTSSNVKNEPNVREETRNQRERSRSPIRNRNNAQVPIQRPWNNAPNLPYGYGNFRVFRGRGPPPTGYGPRPRFHPYNPRMY